MLMVLVKYIAHQSFLFFITSSKNIVDVVITLCAAVGTVFSEIDGVYDKNDPRWNVLKLLRLAPVCWLILRLRLPSVMERVFLNKVGQTRGVSK
jgi:hypothetical protein